jgi:hypothetical protein
MTELEQLRAEVRGLRERSQAYDIAFGGLLSISEITIQILGTLSEELDDDAPARQSLAVCIQYWQSLTDEIMSQMKAFSPLPNTPKAN